MGPLFGSTLAPLGPNSDLTLAKLAYVGRCTIGTYWTLVVLQIRFQ